VIKKKYSVDLAGQLAECEANYARIMKLLPDMDSVDQRDFGVELTGAGLVQIRIEVKERCKYTTMIDISQQVQSDVSLWASTPCFSLRVYHDARMAEVIAFDQHQRLRPSYDYPNANMYHRDEKIQLNIYLGEWLSHCLEFGRILGNPVAKNVCFLADFD